ncbi:MAG: drrA [Candidatus Adlerbacteria bacterium]|nr:drrA [Candidatus Adlerbacteria bacterium]
MQDAAIYTKGLTKSYGKLSVLKGVDLVVERGTMLALLGPNGAGKTTIVRILSTLIEPDGGEVKVGGFDVVREGNDVRRTIGLTGQYAAIDDYLTGRQNLEMMGRLYHLSKADSATRAQELLEQFSLTDASERIAKTYSGGMRRRLDLAASLVATPPIIFLDEPTTGLDPRSRLQMWEVIEGLRRAGTTILLTTQYLEEADKLADRIAVIDHGTVIAEGTADELKAKVGKERLEVVVGEAHVERAAQAMGEGAHVDREEGTVSIAAAGVGEVRRALEALENAGVMVESLSLHKPTLDDVFLKLTGHEAEEAAAKN